MSKLEQIDRKYKNIIKDSLKEIEKYNINTAFMEEMLDMTDFNINKNLVLDKKHKNISGNYQPIPKAYGENIIYEKANMNVIEEEDSDIIFVHELMHLLATRKIQNIDNKFIVDKGMQNFEVVISKKDKEVIIKSRTEDIVLNVAIDEAMTEFIRMNISDKSYSKYYKNRYTMLYIAIDMILKLLFSNEYKEKAFEIYFENPNILYEELSKYNIGENKIKQVFSNMLSSLNQGLISVISIITLTEEFIPFIEKVMNQVKEKQNLSEEEIKEIVGLKKDKELLDKLFNDLLK